MLPGNRETTLMNRCRLGRAGNKDEEAEWEEGMKILGPDSTATTEVAGAQECLSKGLY